MYEEAEKGGTALLVSSFFYKGKQTYVHVKVGIGSSSSRAM